MPLRVRIKLNRETYRRVSGGSTGDHRTLQALGEGFPGGDGDIMEIVMGFLSISVYLSVASVSIQWRNAWGQKSTVTSRRWAVQSCSCLDWARACGLEIWDSPCLFAAAEGRLDVLQHAVALGFSRDGMPICEWAAEAGHLEVVKWCRANGYPWGRSSMWAAERGHLEVLKWCVANGCPVKVGRRSSRGIPRIVSHRGHYRGKQLNPLKVFDVSDAAAKGGHLETVKWCAEQGYPRSWKTSRIAAMAGHLDVLKWLIADGCPWHVGSIAWAASSGSLELLKWCKANHGPWGDHAVLAAADGGNLEVFKLCVENNPHNRLLHVCFPRAAEQGHLGVVQWMRSNGYPWADRTCYSAACGGQLEVLKWCIANGCPWGKPWGSVQTAFRGSVSMMMWAASNGCPWMLTKVGLCVMCNHAARGGNLEVLQWCTTYQPSSILVISQEDASSEQMHILDLLQARDRPRVWGKATSFIMKAAASGSLETVKWCRANNFPWDTLASDEAMASGNLELWQWCRENGLPWGNNAAKMAILQTGIEGLAWCHANGYPLNAGSIRERFANGYDEIIEWCRDHLPPKPGEHGSDLCR